MQIKIILRKKALFLWNKQWLLLPLYFLQEKKEHKSLQKLVNSDLPNDIILDQSKLKAFADDKINVNEELKFGLGERQKTLWEKEKMLFTQHFLLFLRFQKASLSSLLKLGINLLSWNIVKSWILY